MKASASNRRIRNLLTDIRTGALVPNPEFQRRLVWSNKHKSAFIETVLRGFPFPEIYVAASEVNPDTGEGKEMLVDGQQRVTTLKQYFEASLDLRLSKGVLPYSKLTDDEKKDFLEYGVAVRDLGHISTSEIKQIFQRINSTNYSLNAMEIHNARYDGEIKEFAEELAQDRFFDDHRVFRTNEIRRMNDTRFALSVLITAMSAYFDRDRDLESYLVQYNDELEDKEDLKSEFQKVFEFIDNCNLPKNSRAWGKADLFTLLVEVHRALIKQNTTLDPAIVGIRLGQFYESVDKLRSSEGEIERKNSRLSRYYIATQQGTNHRTSRINRGKILQDVISGEFVFGKERTPEYG